MLKILKTLVLVTFFITSVSVSGQYYDGGVSLTGLYTEENGYNAHLNYSHRVFNYFDFIDVGIQVSSSDLSLGDFDIPTTLYAFNAGFYYDLIRNNRRFFYKNALALTVGGGVQIGQESFDFDEIPLVEGQTINVDEEKIVFGPYVGANIDFYLNSVFAVAFRVTETYHINSDLGDLIPYVGLGVKFVWSYK